MQLMTDDPEDQVVNWASRTYSATPTSYYKPPAVAQPTPAPAPVTTAPAVSTNVANWYQNVLGRQPDQAGLDYWQNAVNSGMNVQDLYNDFVKASTANHEATVNTNTSWAAANATPAKPAPVTQASLPSNPLYTPTTTPAYTPSSAPAPVLASNPKPATTTTPPPPAPVTMPAPVMTSVPATSTVSSPIAAATGALGTVLNTVYNQATASQPAPAIVQGAANVVNAVNPGAASAVTSPKVDVNSWYRSVLGRDGDPAGVKFWQDAVNATGSNPQQLYSDFVKAATANQEQVNSSTSWANANTYTGPASSNPNSIADDWGRNVLGRELTAAELSKWDGLMAKATTPAAAQQVYAQFLTENANAVKNQLSLSQASQIAGAPKTASATTGGQVLPGASTSTPATGTPATTTPAPSNYQVPANVNVSAWYLNELGRLPSASEVAYWQQQLQAGGNPEATYAQFAAAAKANGETVTPVSWAQANTYTPKGSSAGSIIPPAAPAVDWAKLQEQIKAPTIDWSKLAVPQIDWSKMPTIPTTDWSTMTPDIKLPDLPQVVIPELNPTQIKTQDLAVRNVQANETVDGQLQMLLAENSPVLQQQRAQAMRAAADRGMANSALAASGADDAMTKVATTIAAQDAGTYGKAADYNVTANNQAIMWNADTAAQAERLQAQLKDAAATRQQQLYTAQMNEATQRQQTAQQLLIAQMQDNTQRAQYAQQMAQAQIQDQTQRAQLAQNLAIAQMQDATARAQAAQQLAIAQLQDATTRAGQSNQMTIAQMQDATQRFQSELSSSTSRYNTDSSYKQQMDSQRNSLANNIIMNMEMSPDRKAAMLESLGLGTSASRNPDGTIKYGTGLAGAVYVIGSTSSDLNFSGQPGTGGNGYYNQV
jgi:hypothetical protein